MDHLDAIDNLRQGINLRGYGQRDPIVEYKNEAFKMLEMLVKSIDDQAVHRIFKIQVHQHEHEKTKETGETKGTKSKSLKGSKEPEEPKKQLQENLKKKKLGRNDPCW